ncbi:general receptor for phosphoinositides 1-associated scaffold protein [Rhincodon typus]|uniref:general receptor for phosphoinositides 1-associated scaffold protein n=1 Tax=Rhincodon typus TaxID=259920 RepID=UPI00202FF9F0|nr:general receptor for phosphoinositides 1-associated scaffold protein [Rhincodon typus]
MTFRRVKKLSRKEDYGSAECTGADSDIYKSGAETYKTSAETCKTSELYKTLAYSGGTLPRSHKQRSLMKWKTLTDSPEHERRIITLEKQDGEAFGFEIQTYGLHHRDEKSMEMCTFVCRVRENTPAELGGLRQGNEQALLHLWLSSLLMLETVYGTSIRRAELETRLQYLKQTLQEKWEEYRSLMVQEQRLVHGIVSKDPSVYDAFESVTASLCGQTHYLSPSAQRQPGSGGSTRSSAMEGDDEPIYQTCIFDPLDMGSDDSHGSEVVLAKKLLTRSVSAKAGHNGVSSSTWDKVNNQSAFGTLPRKSRRKSLRKRLLKYIPGLNRSVEEEESQL